MADSEGFPYPPRKDGYVDCLTPSQENALKELCKRLPATLDIFSAEHLTLWGVPLADLVHPQQSQQPKEGSDTATDAAAAAAGGAAAPAPAPTAAPANGGGDAGSGPSRAQRVVLLKFLRARQWHVAAALTQLVNCLKWRRDFDVAGLSSETFPQQLAAAGQLSGRDRAGNPVTYNYYGTDVDLQSVLSGPGGVASFVRWRVKLMEQAVALLEFEGGIEHVMQVHDYSGASMFRMDAQMKTASREIIKLFQDNYPEMLSAKLFLNVPVVMEFLFSLFTTFSDVNTRAKFTMASPQRSRPLLLRYIDPVQLPERYRSEADDK
ncbi:hypothetical protein Agub_g12310 [Astrephomene gubernaculifera]|uniref:CRAL-TRIO domain-containing protein n=1 Tax=Astrephomene gubernaculifera TaxID=47775 RepID=A0AAD3HR78_9CHLO|nr:hypothetical protein Agub_g12310 [Astrephomene gubernaculifera]